MSKNKSRIQFLLNEYIEKFGSIDLLLPDGVGVEIGITQEGKRGVEKRPEYCWVVTSRDDRFTTFDRYAMSMHFSEDKDRTILDVADQGTVTVI